jgi:hypothetical protein
MTANGIRMRREGNESLAARELNLQTFVAR